ncbi:MAG TPA: PKD domain-containing protein [Chitinophagaceae bacterium]|nr:PKD domain-containing protein [Chitinophagaceae bacterium]
MRKNLLSILGLLVCHLQLFSQAVVATESFDATTYPPTGWSIKPAMTPTNVWVRQTSPTTNPTTTSHSGAAVSRFRSRNVAAGTKQILVTRAVDYTNRGTQAANLDFWMYRDSLLPGNPDSLTVWVNNTDTLDANAVYLGTIARNRTIALPDTQAVNGWYHFVYSIPSTFTGTSTRFIFEGTGQSAVVNSGANIFIDDVSFDEFPAVCTGTPNVGTIVSSNPVICGGSGSSVLSLSAPVTGLSGISYIWETATSSAGPWTPAGTTLTLNTGTLTTTTWYRCTVNCSFSGMSYVTPIDSVIVSTSTPPVVLITPSSAVYCAGTSGVQLIASGASTYSWSPATGLNISTGDTVYASPAANTQFIVTGTDINGCSDTAAVNVTFNAGPTVAITANPSDTVCAGTQVILTSTPTGGAGNTYLWSDGAITRRDTIILNTTTSYSVVVTNAAGCSNSDSTTIVALPPTQAIFGYTATGNTIQFSDNSVSAAGWIWSFGDGNGSTNQNPLYTYSAPGTYTVTLIVSGNGCNDDTTTMVIVIGPSGLSSPSNTNFSCYPNPVQQEVVLQGDRMLGVEILDVTGKRYIETSLDQPQQVLHLPVASLRSGMYFAQIQTFTGKHLIRFIKE